MTLAERASLRRTIAERGQQIAQLQTRLWELEDEQEIDRARLNADTGARARLRVVG